MPWRRSGFLVAEPGIDRRPAVMVGEQVDVHVIEPERQLGSPSPAGAGRLHVAFWKIFESARPAWFETPRSAGSSP